MTVPSGVLSNSANSSSFELLAESHFLSELLQEMWFYRHQLVDVLHSQVDAFGYDIVLTTDSVTRHVQLKTRRKGAKTARLSLNTQLEALPSACVILMDWAAPTPSSRFRIEYLWFGGEPRERIPLLGAQVAKHSKGDAAGTKLLRPQIRTVSIGANFEHIGSISDLATRLFGRC